MVTCHYIFVLTIKWTSPRVDPKVNYGLWVIMMCQCSFTYHSDGGC